MKRMKNAWSDEEKTEVERKGEELLSVISLS